MHGLAHEHANLLLCLDGRGERGFPSLHLICCFLRSKFVVDDLERASLLYRAIGSGAVLTVDRLSCQRIDSFTKPGSLNIVEVWPSKSFEELSSIRLGK